MNPAAPDATSIGHDVPKRSDEVARRVLALVRARGLGAGERLPAERLLAEDLRVSRTALREGLQQLISQGLLESRRGAGNYVRRAGDPGWLQDAVGPLKGLLHEDSAYRFDVLEARQALERSTAWHAARRATRQDHDRLRRCFDLLQDSQQCNDPDRSAKADARFHLAIAEASHNLVLVQIMRGLFDLVLSSVTISRRTLFNDQRPDTLAQLTTQHRALMDAITQGDATAARDLAGEHLDYVHLALRQRDEDAAQRERALRLPEFPRELRP